MKNISACLSHNHDDWRTPSDLYFYFTGYLHCYDVCPFLSKEDLFMKDFDSKVFYMNPPFSKLSDWIDYAIWLCKEKKHFGYILMPTRTDTQYFKRIYPFISEIFFITGRLHFNDSPTVAPFPTMILFVRDLDLNLDQIKITHCITVEDFIKTGYGI